VGAQNDVLLDGGDNSVGGGDTLQVGATFTSSGDGQITNIENVVLTAPTTLNLSNQTDSFNITGSSGADTITAGSGNDTITGGLGADTLAGGLGDDTYRFAVGDVAAGETLTDTSGTDTIRTTATGATSVDLSNLNGGTTSLQGGTAGIDQI